MCPIFVLNIPPNAPHQTTVGVLVQFNIVCHILARVGQPGDLYLFCLSPTAVQS